MLVVPEWNVFQSETRGCFKAEMEPVTCYQPVWLAIQVLTESPASKIHTAVRRILQGQGHIRAYRKRTALKRLHQSSRASIPALDSHEQYVGLRISFSH